MAQEGNSGTALCKHLQSPFPWDTGIPPKLPLPLPGPRTCPTDPDLHLGQAPRDQGPWVQEAISLTDPEGWCYPKRPGEKPTDLPPAHPNLG